MGRVLGQCHALLAAAQCILGQPALGYFQLQGPVQLFDQRQRLLHLSLLRPNLPTHADLFEAVGDGPAQVLGAATSLGQKVVGAALHALDCECDIGVSSQDYDCVVIVLSWTQLVQELQPSHVGEQVIEQYDIRPACRSQCEPKIAPVGDQGRRNDWLARRAQAQAGRNSVDGFSRVAVRFSTAAAAAATVAPIAADRSNRFKELPMGIFTRLLTVDCPQEIRCEPDGQHPAFVVRFGGRRDPLSPGHCACAGARDSA
jgi:hypothetical protein